MRCNICEDGYDLNEFYGTCKKKDAPFITSGNQIIVKDLQTQNWINKPIQISDRRNQITE